jgi:hypothetical protein
MASQNKVEMVGHQAISEQNHRHAGAGVDHDVDKGIIIAGLVENCLTVGTPVQVVISLPTN